jgi:hypothetical protein
MAVDTGIPPNLGRAIRMAIFWGAVPFIGILLGAEDVRKGEYLWGLGFFAVAFLSVAFSVYWDVVAQKREAKPKPLEYLGHEDAELGPAIRDMAWRSAWGRWYAAQRLSSNPKGLPEHREDELMHVAANQVWQALLDGKLEARGRKPGELDYESIPATHWRSSPLHMVRDNVTLWRMILIPTGGAEISPDGTVTAHDHVAKERTDNLAAYDSIIVRARQFESLWPRIERKTDGERRRLLKAARKANAAPSEIEKLSQDDKRSLGVLLAAALAVCAVIMLSGYYWLASKTAKTPVKTAAPSITLPAASNSPVASNQNSASADRVYTSKTMTELRGFYKDRTALQAEAFMADEIGKWINTEGAIRFIRPDGLVFLVDNGGEITSCEFDAGWKPKLGAFRPGEIMKVVGKIGTGQTGASPIYLRPCEIRD